jgi:hypothetical protein
MTGLLVVFFILAVDIALAVVFGRMAGRKGYSAAGFGFLVFFIGVIGMIIVAVLPDKAAARRQEELLVAVHQAQTGAVPSVPGQPGLSAKPQVAYANPTGGGGAFSQYRPS